MPRFLKRAAPSSNLITQGHCNQSLRCHCRKVLRNIYGPLLHDCCTLKENMFSWVITCQSSTTYCRTGRHCPLELDGVCGNSGTCESVTLSISRVRRPGLSNFSPGLAPIAFNLSPLLVQETPTTTAAIPNSCWIHAWESRVRALEKCTMINHILAFLLIRI